ncbi:MAG TPA: NTP transferase domain-containing protein [Acidimicrobiales bacterium]
MPPVPPVPRFAGAVLCGGASRRMGRDKALIEIDGRPLAVRVADAVGAAGAGTVVAVGGDLAALRAAGLAAVPDDEPGAGPLVGVVTALAAAGTLAGAARPAGRGRGAGAAAPPADDIVFVAACDLVDPSPAAIAATVRALATSEGGDIAVPLVDGRRQWVHAAWRRHARAPLAAAFEAGERAIHAAVAASGMRVVDVALDAHDVADADAPADLPFGR